MLTLPCFAKINWVLKVLDRRPDGYHEVLTVLQTIDLHDLLSVEASPAESLGLSVTGIALPEDDGNLVLRAARALLGYAQVRRGARIRLAKRTPVGAGLGGGSSDAAIALLALNQFWNLGLSFDELDRLAASLGSDVPFFLRGGTQLASGRGERLSPIDPQIDGRRLIVLYPAAEIRASEAYALLDCERGESRLTRSRAESTIQRFCRSGESRGELWAALENDFETPLYNRYPLLADARRVLENAGCGKTLISGSGSSLLGFADPDRIEGVCGRAAGHASAGVFLTRTLGCTQYWRRLAECGLSDPRASA